MFSMGLAKTSTFPVRRYSIRLCSTVLKKSRESRNCCATLLSSGGTSLATPVWAAITALIDQYLTAHGGRPAGFVNPLLYRLARESPPYRPCARCAPHAPQKDPSGTPDPQ